jgi:hypothetical protein
VIHGSVAFEINQAVSVYDVLPVQHIAMAVYHNMDTCVLRGFSPLPGKWQIHFPVFCTEAITYWAIVQTGCIRFQLLAKLAIYISDAVCINSFRYPVIQTCMYKKERAILTGQTDFPEKPVELPFRPEKQ